VSNPTDPSSQPPPAVPVIPVSVGQKRREPGKPEDVRGLVIVEHDATHTPPWGIAYPDHAGEVKRAWVTEAYILDHFPIVLPYKRPDDTNLHHASDLLRLPDELRGRMSAAELDTFKAAVESLRTIESEIARDEQVRSALKQGAYLEEVGAFILSLGDVSVDDVAKALVPWVDNGEWMTLRKRGGDLPPGEHGARLLRASGMVEEFTSRLDESKRKSAARVEEIKGFIQSFGYDRLEREIVAAEQRHKDDTAAADGRHKDELAAADRRHQEALKAQRDGIAAAKDQHKDELAAADRRHQEALKAQQDEFAAAEKRHKEALKAQQDEFAAAKDQHKDELAAADRRHQEALKAQQDEFAAAEKRHKEALKAQQNDAADTERRHKDALKAQQDEFAAAEKRHKEALRTNKFTMYVGIAAVVCAVGAAVASAKYAIRSAEIQAEATIRAANSPASSVTASTSASAAPSRQHGSCDPQQSSCNE
jgi:hypothetical protein